MSKEELKQLLIESVIDNLSSYHNHYTEADIVYRCGCDYKRIRDYYDVDITDDEIEKIAYEAWGDWQETAKQAELEAERGC